MNFHLIKNQLYYHNSSLKLLDEKISSLKAGRYLMLNLAQGVGLLSESLKLTQLITDFSLNLLDSFIDWDRSSFDNLIKEDSVKILKTVAVTYASHLIGVIPLVGQIFGYYLSKYSEKIRDPSFEQFQKTAAEKGFIWPLENGNKKSKPPGLSSRLVRMLICIIPLFVLKISNFASGVFLKLSNLLLSLFSLDYCSYKSNSKALLDQGKKSAPYALFTALALSRIVTMSITSKIALISLGYMVSQVAIFHKRAQQTS